jgi:hypothetical protein
MTRFEFHWSVVPALHVRALQQFERDGFKIQFSGPAIVCKSDFTAVSETEMRARSKAIAECTLLAVSYRQKIKATLEFDYEKLEHATPVASQILLRIHDKLPEIVSEATVRMSYVKLGATIVQALPDDDSKQIADLSQRINDSAAVRKMLQWMVEFSHDSERMLAPLYNIIELAATELNGTSNLGVSATKLRRAKGIMNNKTIRTSRHPGQEQGDLREITSDELAFCQEVADGILESFLRPRSKGGNA